MEEQSTISEEWQVTFQKKNTICNVFKRCHYCEYLFKKEVFGEECFSFNQNEEHRLGALLTWAIPYKIPINKVNIC